LIIFGGSYAFVVFDNLLSIIGCIKNTSLYEWVDSRVIAVAAKVDLKELIDLIQLNYFVMIINLRGSSGYQLFNLIFYCSITYLIVSHSLQHFVKFYSTYINKVNLI
jgi:hypothetical protein